MRKWSPQTEARTVDNVGTAIEAPIVQVVIVTWNKEKDVLQLLDQLGHISYPRDKYEITVVDNNSSDNTVQLIESKYPSVTLIKNPENLGGAGGFNAGMRWVLEKRPESKYMWLLDNDVIVDGNALKELVVVMERRGDAMMCGSRVMNPAEPTEIIEVGAFIDYAFGTIRRNKSQKGLLKNNDVVFEVDYVAACSMLVRTSIVQQLGMLNETLFVYWDDMEWGARLNALGYKALASPLSVVYHPDWAKRTQDNSAIWRSYYRTRNSLWFFNNYTCGLRRRFLLGLIVLREMRAALRACLNSDVRRFRAIMRGIEDFLHGNYGKRNFQMPDCSLQECVANHQAEAVCIFLRDAKLHESAKAFVGTLMSSYPSMKILSIVPDEVGHVWKDFLGKENVMACPRLTDAPIPLANKLKIARFLYSRPWKILVTSPRSIGYACFWRKRIARVDFDKGVVLSIARVSIMDFISIPFATVSFLIKTFVRPPDCQA